MLGGMLWLRWREERSGRSELPAAMIPSASEIFARARARLLGKQMHALRDAANNLPDAVVILDAEDRVRWFNHAAERLLGLVRGVDRGVVLTQRLGSDILTTWLQADGATALDEFSTPADPRARLSLAAIRLAGNERLLIARDVSALLHLEQVRRDFVANVSHELRTPLTVIHGYLEMIDSEDVPSLAPVLGEMRAQSKRMAQIVEDLLTLSRLEMQQHLRDETVAMTPLLAGLRKEATALSKGRHSIALEDTAACNLVGSSGDLQSTFSNLVSNAVRYTPAGGSITIRWQREPDGGARYSVIDTGYGIPAQHLPRLTERFYRVSSSRSRETGGTGLGLSIVKHVLALHQAQFEVQSEPGKGSTFSCVFPSGRVREPGTDDE
ncbi:MAG: phosphate regulon sensor histidine kinase PhoR [Rhodanobacteraceae bacterium]